LELVKVEVDAIIQDFFITCGTVSSNNTLGVPSAYNKHVLQLNTQKSLPRVPLFRVCCWAKLNNSARMKVIEVQMGSTAL